MSPRPAKLAMLVVSTVLLLAACQANAAQRGGQAPSPADWSPARPVPRVTGLLSGNLLGNYSHVGSLSCPSRAACTMAYLAGTSFSEEAQHPADAVSKAGGTWLAPRQIFGPNAEGISLACVAYGNCLADGIARTNSNSGPIPHALIALQARGAWSRARPIPGLATLNNGGPTELDALACGSAGWCVLAGLYWPRGTMHPQNNAFARPFVVSELNGTWHTPQVVPGIPVVPLLSWFSWIGLSCDPAGSWCSAVFGYQAGNVPIKFLAISDSNGTWGPAQVIHEPAGGLAGVTAISCAGPGACVAAGAIWFRAAGNTPPSVFVVARRHGTWGRATILPATFTIRSEQQTWETSITGLSCGAPGRCGLTGYYSENFQGESSYMPIRAIPFVANLAGGRWNALRRIPGLAALNRGGLAEPTSLSCAANGTCAVGGYYSTNPITPDGNLASFHSRAFVVTQVDGGWSQAVPVPGLASLTSGGSEVDFVSCWSSGGCIAVGDYHSTTPGPQHAFVTTAP